MEVTERIESEVAYRRPFRHAAVLGAGVMGAQIAAHLANAGLEVELLDLAAEEGPKNALAATALDRAANQTPTPFFTRHTRERIRPGNYDEHLDRLGNCDWIIEAVVERLDVKRQLFAKVAPHIALNAVISTNTSGLSVSEIAGLLGKDLQRRFLGTHFFNPPRYLKLLEIIPGRVTDPEVVERVTHFADTYLGKGVVLARDTPNFIANRIGLFALVRAMREFLEGRFTIEEVDLLTGKLVGRPKSGTFRTADLVGLDTMRHVLIHLNDSLPPDEARLFAVPDLLSNLVEEGRTGEKTRAGFYKKEGDEILSIDADSLEYRAVEPGDLGDVEALQGVRNLRERLRSLYRADGRAGDFFRDTTLDILAYAARVTPIIADGPLSVDRAIRWGFNYELGPFELWDALGFESILNDMRSNDIHVPDWIERLAVEGDGVFYRPDPRRVSVWKPDGGYDVEPRAYYDLGLSQIRHEPDRTIYENDECALLDIGEQVALLEFRSKANTLGFAVIEGLRKGLQIVENGDWRGLVIGNEGSNFSVGANLAEIAGAVLRRKMDEVAKAIVRFQDTMQMIRYAPKPVVVGVHQRALGGGCELVMAAPRVVAAAESYIGLVELGVGLIPAGGGCMRIAAHAADSAPSSHPSQIQSYLRKSFQTVAEASVSTSALHAREMGFLTSSDQIVMNADRRLYAARETVIHLSNIGYCAPPKRRSIRVLGRPGAAQFDAALNQYEAAGRISPYDRFLAGRLAYVVTGGDLTRPEDVSEEYLLGLEREVFLSLLGEKKTHERVKGLLETGKPVRN